jgi:hypothetical protein
MARCPVDNCLQALPVEQVQLAQHAADLNLFFPMLDRLRARLPSEQLDWMDAFTRQGRDFSTNIHAAAHGSAAADVPSLEELDPWRNAAHEITQQLMQIDRKWYKSYWKSYFKQHPNERRFAS